MIPKGFQITVSSWENDADNYKKAVKNGLGLEELKFFYELASLFKDNSKISNLYDPDDEKLELLNSTLIKFSKKYPDFIKQFDSTDDETIIDAVMDHMHELELTGEDFTTRVTSKIEVEYIPENVYTVDLTDKMDTVLATSLENIQDLLTDYTDSKCEPL